MTMNLGDIFVGAAAAFMLALTAWFFIGAQWNVKRIHDVLRWLRAGLPLLGERTTMRWLGTTGVHLGMEAANAPFKSVELMILMEPRDVVPLWLLSHLQGRRDILLVRGHLRRHARVEFDLLDKTSWSGKDALRHNIAKEWPRSTLSDGFLLASEGADATLAAQQVKAQLGRLAPNLYRIAVRRTVPHVEVYLLAPWKSGVSSTDMLKMMKEVGNLLLPP
jgi:hypothetical protein